MIKSNKFNILLCSAFVCNTQFSNAGFEEDWASVKDKIKQFNEYKDYLSRVFEKYENTGYYIKNVLRIFGNKDIFEGTRNNLLNLKRSFVEIEKLLNKILTENITTYEIFNLALFKFPNIKKDFNNVFETIYKTFYLVPCYKTFSLLSMNLDTSLEIVQDKYAKYACAPDQLGIKVYRIDNCEHYIFTDLHNHNKCLYEYQIGLNKKLINHEYRINVPTLYKEQIDIYDMCCDILSGNVTSENFGQKLEDCLAYTDEFGYVYFPIPSNQELWPQAIDIFIKGLKNSAQTEEEFYTYLENFLWNIYSTFNNPVRYVIEDFKIDFLFDNISEKETFHYNYPELTIIPLATDCSVIEAFLQTLNKYILEKKHFSKHNAVRLLMKAMEAKQIEAIHTKKVCYSIKRKQTKKFEKTYELQLVHTPVKLKRSFSQEF